MGGSICLWPLAFGDAKLMDMASISLPAAPVGSEFMEIRHAQRALRIIFGGWIVAVGPLSAGSV
ncbi:hypothetical protein AWB99_20825 [Mycolicibacterium confluentis]|uniref:Uncharacterized protein n=1 Tax=Mycolicibacterium confluentis TaxID=28047 RepID=A0A7I7XUC7_9MYCO|nr:hypothetical protein AWB99_20825 [Mycolicibacterium confluentis]BBZ32858.1 hypothetical protein MCNF_14630 [Mycolicibacterium confluentis]